MADRISSEQRSKVMSRVKGKDTAIERLVRSELHRQGFRFRKNVSKMPGKPDIVLPKYKCVIFIHGCFWHQHQDCRRSQRPTSNTEFWNAKLDKNTERDKQNVQILETSGWKTVIVWECQIKEKSELVERLKKEILA